MIFNICGKTYNIMIFKYFKRVLKVNKNVSPSLLLKIKENPRNRNVSDEEIGRRNAVASSAAGRSLAG